MFSNDPNDYEKERQLFPRFRPNLVLVFVAVLIFVSFMLQIQRCTSETQERVREIDIDVPRLVGGSSFRVFDVLHAEICDDNGWSYTICEHVPQVLFVDGETIFEQLRLETSTRGEWLFTSPRKYYESTRMWLLLPADSNAFVYVNNQRIDYISMHLSDIIYEFGGTGWIITDRIARAQNWLLANYEKGYFTYIPPQIHQFDRMINNEVIHD